MAEGKRDQNSVVVAMVKNQATGLPSPILVDNVTGYVLVVEASTSHVPPVTLAGKPDANNVYTSLARNSSTGAANSITTDSAGNLKITTA